MAIFLAEGDRLAISYEIEEMRETGIIWMIVIYAVWPFVRSRRSLASGTGKVASSGM